ncbi:MAG: helix-turn-helix transcriptional regulator [Pusillimonas sp.]
MTQPLLKPQADDASVVNLRDGVGATLKALRLARHVTLADASARLKYSSRQLQALENEQWADLPSGLPLRGLIKNYARFLEADVDAVLVMLANQTGEVATPKIGISPVNGGTEFTPADLPVHAEGGSFSWGWFLVILLVVVAAGFYAIDRGWLPESWMVFDWLRPSANP